MRNYMVMLFAVCLLAGCKGNNKVVDEGVYEIAQTSAEADSVTFESEYDGAEADMAASEDEGTDAWLKKATYEGERVYTQSVPEIGDGYLSYKYSIEWPEEVMVKGVDNDKFRAFVAKNVFDARGTDINSLIKNHCRKVASTFDAVPTTKVTYEQVDKMRENGGSMQLYPTGKISNKILAYDARGNIISMAVTSVMDLDNGAGMGFLCYETTVYYDCQRNRQIGLNDLVSNKSKLLAAVKETALSKLDEFFCLEETAVMDLTKLPDNFAISDTGLRFIFPQYEIACGADGNVEIDVPFDKVMDCLTPLGKNIAAGQNRR